MTPLTTALDRLPVAAASHAATYQREAFGPAWTDTDHNGCDTRNDVLRRDLTSVVARNCSVQSGSLPDPYSGTTIAFVKGSSLVEIDHVVALGDAWQSGAWAWPYAKLLAFANDPLNLLAVSGSLNSAKGDSSAAVWLPPREQCAYVARQVAVKGKYGLLVTAPERVALKRVASRCGSVAVPSGGNPTVATNRAPPTPSTVASGDPDFGSCAAAKAAGKGPYVRGRDPEYSFYDDRDGDGVVCE